MIGPLHQADPIPTQALDDLRRMLETGDLFRYHASENAPVTLLEQEFAAMMGARFALAVSSCSAALFLSLTALDMPRDARVLVPAFTFAAVPSAIVHANCIPVLVEVGENYRMDMADFEAKLTPDISAVIVSHMRGHTSDMDTIMRLCNAAGIPVIEDAAHSLGTVWNGAKIGTLGRVGCFSFQSYKLVNGGEGGILITDNEDLIARAVIMSGAYENNWQKHKCDTDRFGAYQNMLPLYNTRMSNLSAAIIRPQLALVEKRASDGLRNHDYVAAKLSAHEHLVVPAALPAEQRAPDSIQFNLVGFSDTEARTFMDISAANGLAISIFGLHGPNARVFWNWKFLGDQPDLPQTRAMLMRACDIRLPASLPKEDLDQVINHVLTSVDRAKGALAA